jgi:histidine ammonia-lyase
MKPQSGQRVCAQIIQDNLSDSKLINTSGRVQDPYSFRCIPQVLGPVLDMFEYAKVINQLEMNSATDNPLIFPQDDQIISGGNFHAQPIALCADYLAIVLQTVGEISERRVNQFLDANLSGNLPAFLIDQPGLKSGFMIVQYTDAALVSRNKILCYPASATSIPVSANQEDIVSQAPNACSKLSEIVANLAKIIAIEMLTAAQAIEFRDKDNLGATGRQIYEKIRTISKPVIEDRSLQNDIEDLSRLILLGSFQKELPFDVTL